MQLFTRPRAVSALLMASILAAAPMAAHAQHWRGGGRPGFHGGYHRGGGGGAAIGGALLGLGVGAIAGAALSQPSYAAPPPVYYPAAPAPGYYAAPPGAYYGY